jgi:hypothetical protein
MSMTAEEAGKLYDGCTPDLLQMMGPAGKSREAYVADRVEYSRRREAESKLLHGAASVARPKAAPTLSASRSPRKAKARAVASPAKPTSPPSSGQLALREWAASPAIRQQYGDTPAGQVAFAVQREAELNDAGLQRRITADWWANASRCRDRFVSEAIYAGACNRSTAAAEWDRNARGCQDRFLSQDDYVKARAAALAAAGK